MPEIEMKNVTSSLIDSVGYDAYNLVLKIRFVSNHSEYLYRGVASEVFEAMITAPSIGQYFSKEIKKKYTGEKVSG